MFLWITLKKHLERYGKLVASCISFLLQYFPKCSFDKKDPTKAAIPLNWLLLFIVYLEGIWQWKGYGARWDAAIDTQESTVKRHLFRSALGGSERWSGHSAVNHCAIMESGCGEKKWKSYCILGGLLYLEWVTMSVKAPPSRNSMTTHSSSPTRKLSYMSTMLGWW